MEIDIHKNPTKFFLYVNIDGPWDSNASAQQEWKTGYGITVLFSTKNNINILPFCLSADHYNLIQTI